MTKNTLPSPLTLSHNPEPTLGDALVTSATAVERYLEQDPFSEAEAEEAGIALIEVVAGHLASKGAGLPTYQKLESAVGRPFRNLPVEEEA